MKYKIDDKVIYLGRRCLVKASKLEPFKHTVHPYLAELVPSKDFVLYNLKEITDSAEIYEGTFDVYQDEIEKMGWD